MVLGSGGVGKSALTLRLISDEFATEYDPTIEDSYRKQVSVDQVPALLDVLDTAGQEEYASLQDQWIREGDGFLVVYAVNNKTSYEDCVTIIDKIQRIVDKDFSKIPVVIAGNKCDLKDQRTVSLEEVQSESNANGKWPNAPVFDTSAKTKENVENCFFTVVREIRKSRKEDETKTTKKKGMCILL